MLRKIKEPEQLLQTLNPDFCTKRYSEQNTELKALRAGVIKLSEINQAYTPGTSEDLIQAWLLSLSMYVRIEVDKKLIQEISIELYKEIYMLNMAELTLFFSKLRRGIYGPLYGRFDGMMICIAAREYRQTRGTELAKLTSEEQSQILS